MAVFVPFVLCKSDQVPAIKTSPRGHLGLNYNQRLKSLIIFKMLTYTNIMKGSRVKWVSRSYILCIYI